MLFAGISYNDPTCEAAKAHQNAIYQLERKSCEVQNASAKLDCERLKTREKLECEIAREQEISEAAKVGEDVSASFNRVDSSLFQPIDRILKEKVAPAFPTLDLDSVRTVTATEVRELPPIFTDTLKNIGALSWESIIAVDTPDGRFDDARVAVAALLEMQFATEMGRDAFSAIILFEHDTLRRYIRQRTEAICAALPC